MSVQRIFHHCTSVKSKKHEFYVIIGLSLMAIIQFHQYTSRRENQMYIPISLLVIYADRSHILSDQCNHSNTSSSSIENYSPTNLVKNYPWLNAALFPVQSRSLLYCAIPKIASKTLVSVIMYVYVRDILDQLTQNSTSNGVNRADAEKFINLSKLTEQLRKNGIAVPPPTEPDFIVAVLHIFLHLLRYESVNSSSIPVYMNPWRLSLDQIFPKIQFKSVSNMSKILSPSFTRALFVRHPFERLASAYKERIGTLQKDRIQPEPHYDTVRKLICRRFTRFNPGAQPSEIRKACDDHIPSFEQFVRFILPNTKKPVDIGRMDGHWKPYTTVCQVCQLQYNFIGKYETFDEDFTIFLKRLNLSDWNVKKRRGASGYTTWQYRELYSSLPDDLICRLKDIYYDDFQLFGYQIEDYINRTRVACS